MSSHIPKKKGNYKKHKTLSIGEPIKMPSVESSNSNGAERSLMYHFILPFLSVLNQFLVPLYNFVEIWKKYKVLKCDQEKILLAEQSHIKVKEIISSNRQLMHTNSEEKNIIFTYHAFSDPEGLRQFFVNYIMNNIPNACNKKDLCCELISEIDNIQKVYGNHAESNFTNSSTISLSSDSLSPIPNQQQSVATSAISTNSSPILPSSDPSQQPAVIPSINQPPEVLNGDIDPKDNCFFNVNYDDEGQADFFIQESDEFDYSDFNFSFNYGNHDTFLYI